MKPNPGSREATAIGCTCPVTDNNNGAGVMYAGEVNFWTDEDCPVHHPKSEEKQRCWEKETVLPADHVLACAFGGGS